MSDDVWNKPGFWPWPSSEEGSSKKDKCKYSNRVRIGEVPHSSIDRQKSELLIRKMISTDTRFSSGWPECKITGKKIPINYEYDEDSFTLTGYFRCPNCR